jgi:hypothetical protein
LPTSALFARKDSISDFVSIRGLFKVAGFRFFFGCASLEGAAAEVLGDFSGFVSSFEFIAFT